MITLGGKSSRTGESDSSGSSCGRGVKVRGFTGDEDNKSIVSYSVVAVVCDDGAGRSLALSWAFASAREALTPGFVTFAKDSIRTWGWSLVVLVRLVVVLAFGAAVPVS